MTPLAPARRRGAPGRLRIAGLGGVAVALGLAMAGAACHSSTHAPEPSPAPAPATTPGAVPLLRFADPVLELRTAMGRRQAGEVRLAGAAAARAQLAVQTVEDPALDVQVLPPSGTAPAGLRLAFTGDRTGTRTGEVVVTTGIAELPRLTLLYSLVVPPRITVTPSNPYFNLRDPGARERVLRVHGSAPGFRLVDVRVVDGPFVAALLPPDATGTTEARVRVAVRPDAIEGDQRGFLGKLRLRTNDPQQAEVDVPLFALGALPARDAPHRSAKDAR